MTTVLWASYGDALKLILTGSTTGNMSSQQRTIFTNMLAQGLRDENGARTELRNLPGVNITESCTDNDKQEFETHYYVPDVFRFMVTVYGKWSIHTLPVDFDYLNSMKDESGDVLFNFGGAPSQQEWLDTPEGKEYWDLLCRKIELKNELSDLDTMHHGGIPSERAKLKQLRKEASEELAAITENLAKKQTDAVTQHASAQVVSPYSGWQQRARELGKQYYKQNSLLTIEQIAKKVEKRLKKENITGRGGRTVKKETIQRHALTGIKV